MKSLPSRRLLLTIVASLAMAGAAPGLAHVAAEAGSAANSELHGPPMLVFAADGDDSELEREFSGQNVVPDLQHLHAGIALALPDFSSERAQLVRRLNKASIPVTAWLVLPYDKGYYLNANNAELAPGRFADFQEWTAANGLHWDGVGLDIEPNIQDFAALRQKSKWRLAWILTRRYFGFGRVRHARQAYAGLIRHIQGNGYTVETYQFPFLEDERQERSTVLERLTGIVDARGNREVLMLYTSFNRRLDSALIWLYGPQAGAIAIGSTTGDKSAPQFSPLNWDEFSRDLLVARRFSPIIGVYNLRGSVEQGFLERLQSFNWDQPVKIPPESIREATRLRARVQRAIWVASYLPFFVAGILAAFVIALVFWRRRSVLCLASQ